jgi:hypothetical protein
MDDDEDYIVTNEMRPTRPGARCLAARMRAEEQAIQYMHRALSRFLQLPEEFFDEKEDDNADR